MPRQRALHPDRSSATAATPLFVPRQHQRRKSARPGGAATWFGLASSLYRPDDPARRLRLRHLRREQAGPAREPDSRHGSWSPSSDSAERDSGGLRRGRFRRDLVDRGRHRDDRANACGRSAAPSAASIMRFTGAALDEKAARSWRRDDPYTLQIPSPSCRPQHRSMPFGGGGGGFGSSEGAIV
jgi:hypothetical protein